MKERTSMRRFSIWSLAAAGLSAATLGSWALAAGATAAGKGGMDPRLQLVAALGATAPHSSLGDHARVIDRLIGTWDVEYTDYSKAGQVRHRTGELIFGWVMDGRVMQDLWTVDPSAAGKDREVYTDLFYFDPKSDAWLVASVDPEHPSVARLTGRALGDDRLVLDSQDFGDKDTRWSFDDIRPSSFVFRVTDSNDGGKTWRLQSEYHMSRRAK